MMSIYIMFMLPSVCAEGSASESLFVKFNHLCMAQEDVMMP